MSDRRNDPYLGQFRWAASDLMDNGSFGVVTDDCNAYIVIGTAENLTREQAVSIAEDHNHKGAK